VISELDNEDKDEIPIRFAINNVIKKKRVLMRHENREGYVI